MKERIAAKLTKNKATNNMPAENSESSNNADLIKQFERKINNNSDEFGPALPPKIIKNNFSENVDLRRSVIINQRQKNTEDSSPVPTDGEEDDEEEENIQVSSETSKREVVSNSSSKKVFEVGSEVTAKKESESTNELPDKKSLLEKTEKSSAEVRKIIKKNTREEQPRVNLCGESDQ